MTASAPTARWGEDGYHALPGNMRKLQQRTAQRVWACSVHESSIVRNGPRPCRLARSTLSCLARHGRYVAALDPGRWQDQIVSDALGKPQLAGRAIRDRARSWDIAHPVRERNSRD